MFSKVNNGRIRKFFAILALTVGIVAGSAAQQEMEQIDPAQKALDAKEHAAINQELEAVAWEITKLLEHPGFRGQLRGEINGAKTSESIIVLDKFLAKASKQKNAPPGLDKARGATDKALQRIKNSSAWDIEGIDLYFPVQDHKVKWKGKDDLLVAYSPVNDEADIKNIVAFSVRKQQKVILDPKAPPATPVLIVAAEEHESHEMPVMPRDADPSEPAPPEEDPEDEGEDLGSPGEHGEGNSVIRVKYIKITNDHEPWTSGSPEIYTYTYHVEMDNSCNSDYEWLSDLNKENKWYTYTSYFGMGIFETRFYPHIHRDLIAFRVMERDGGSYRSMSYPLYPGSACHWKKKTGDDHVGTSVIHKSAVPWNSDTYQRFADVRVYWIKYH